MAHLKFARSKFSVVGMGIYHGIVALRGDGKQGENCRSCSYPRQGAVCHQCAQNPSGHPLWLGEGDLAKNYLWYVKCREHDVRYGQVYKKIIYGNSVGLKIEFSSNTYKKLLLVRHMEFKTCFQLGKIRFRN